MFHYAVHPGPGPRHQGNGCPHPSNIHPHASFPGRTQGRRVVCSYQHSDPQSLRNYHPTYLRTYPQPSFQVHVANVYTEEPYSRPIHYRPVTHQVHHQVKHPERPHHVRVSHFDFAFARFLATCVLVSTCALFLLAILF